MSGSAISQLLVELTGSTVKLEQAFTKATSLTQGYAKDVKNLKEIVETAFDFEVGAKLFESIKSLTEGLDHLAEVGEKASNIKEAFESLGGTSESLQKAQQSVMGVVSATDLMTQANRGLIAGIPGFNENFSQVAALGMRVGEALGISTTEGIDKVSEAIIRGRPQQLAQIGIFIDTEKAAKEYAQAHGIAAAASGSFAAALDKTGKQLANSTAAMSQLNEATARFLPPMDDATKAHEAFEATLKTVEEELGKAINQSPQLTQAYRDLGTSIQGLKDPETAQFLANLEAGLLEIASKAIPMIIAALKDMTQVFTQAFGEVSGVVSSVFNHISSEFNSVFGGDAATEATEQKAAALRQTTQAQVDAFEAQQSAIKENSAAFDSLSEKTQAYFENTIDKGIQPATKVVQGLVTEYGELLKQFNSEGASGDPALHAKLVIVGNDLVKLKANAIDFTRTAGDGMDVAAAKTQKLQDELDKFVSENATQKIKTDFEQALQEGNFSAAQGFEEQYATAVSAMADQYFKKFTDAGLEVTDSMRQTFMDKFLTPMTTQLQKSMTDAYNKALETLVSGSKEFISGIDGVTQGLSEVFGVTMPKGMQKVLDIAKGLVSIFEGINQVLQSVDKLTQAFSTIQGLSGSGVTASNPLLGGLASFLGLGGGGALGAQAGLGPTVPGSATGIGSLVPAGGATGIGSLSGSAIGSFVTAAMPYIAVAAGTYLSIKSAQDIIQGKTDNSTQGKLGQAQLAITTGGFSLLGGLLGHSQDADTQARGQVASYLQQNAGFSLNAPKGSAFKEGGDGFAALNQLDATGKQTFEGLGAGLTSVLGIAQNVGPQIGAILAKDLSGNIDQARALVQQLGISQTDMLNAVITSGEKAGQTWLEIEGNIQGVNNAYGVGLAKTGDLKGALDQLITSGDQGQQALTGLTNIAIEGMEAGDKTFAQLKQSLVGILDPKDLNLLMESFSTFGIKSLDDLKNASQQTQIAILAWLQAQGFVFQQVAAGADSATAAVNNLTSAASSFPGLPALGSDTDSAASSGTSTRAAVIGGTAGATLRNLSLSGGRSASNVVSSLSKNQNLSGNASAGGGSSRGITLNIYAPNAEQGVEQKIHSTIMGMSQSIIEQAVNTTVDTINRSGALR